jgi:hypothetical protein
MLNASRPPFAATGSTRQNRRRYAAARNSTRGAAMPQRAIRRDKTNAAKPAQLFAAIIAATSCIPCIFPN